MQKKTQLLNTKKILKYVSNDKIKFFSYLKVLNITGSTNDDVKTSLSSSEKKINHLAIFSEEQISGRGRREKKWISPYGKNIYFSFGWKTHLKPSELNGLSLSVAVTISESLKNLVTEPLKIKWPNDLFISDHKVGGILIETFSLGKGLTGVVIGIGLNILMSQDEGNDINQKWTSLHMHSKKEPNRNQIAGSILNAILNLAIDFKNTGFTPYKKKFDKLNFLKEKLCIITGDNLLLNGVVKGINKDGELILLEGKKTHIIRYGEVTIKKE